MFEQQIETMKRQYTDKYVLVDPARPELARFRDVVGRVKTVNMNGRALVEFDDYHLNIGWYDIDPEFLKVVDQPPPKAPKVEAKKPAAKGDAKPAVAKAPAKAAPAPAVKPAGGKASVADILAAARAGKAAPAKPAGAAAKEAPKPQAASPPAPAAASPPKLDRSKMSVADMLAAARAGGAGTEKAPPATAQAEEPPADPPAPPEPPPAADPAPPAASADDGDKKDVKPVDKSNMTIDDILAYCREHDASS